MKVLRFLLLVATILLAYLGQYLFGNHLRQALPFQSILIPAIDSAPLVRDLLALPQAQLINWAGGLLLAAGMLFGALASPWPTSHRAKSDDAIDAIDPDFHPVVPPQRQRIRPQAGIILLGVALFCALFNGLWIATGHAESWLTVSLWAAGVAAVVAGGWMLSQTGAEPVESAPDAEPEIKPEAGWPILLMILVVVLAVGLWRLTDLPVEVDGDTASHGLQALALVSGQETRLFAPGWANIPLLAYVPAAVGMIFSNQILLGLRLSGLFAGLLTVLATWLLGCEIFRRRPRLGPYGDVAEDDGRWGALMAAGVVAGTVVLLHYSRLPEYLDPVGWGALGLWALLRGLRTRDPLALGVSGLLVGVAGSFYYSGRIFVPVVLVWLLGVLVLRRAWLRSTGPGTGWHGLGVWAVGFGAMVAPVAGYWFQNGQAFVERTQEVSIFNPAVYQHLRSVFGVDAYLGIFLASLRNVALTFNLVADRSSHFGFEGPMLNEFIAPILVLGIGFALIHLFRQSGWLPGWLLLSWFGGVLLSGALTVDAPTWSRMLPVLPVVGLLMALGLDRLRVSLVDNGGGLLDQVSLIALVGLLLVTGVQNFRDYVDYMGFGADQASYVGRAAAALPVDRPIWVYVGSAPDNGHWQDRVPQFLSGAPYNDRFGADIGPGQWQGTLTPGSTIMFHGDDRSVVQEVMATFPGGHLDVRRDKGADPLFYAYTLPE